MTDLPVQSVLPEIREALRTSQAAVLQAPPGAGKTTLVPLAVLDEPWLGSRKIVMLEPRRLAARAAAHRMAYLLGGRVGETVGYRVRLDTVVGPRTRIEVVTQGILTRLLLNDPALEDYGLVIFDEFHERNVQSDLGLALVLQSREVFRDDLRLLVMSATLDGTRVAQLLGSAPVITSEGRVHPVETHYLTEDPGRNVEQAIVRTILRSLARDSGDVLVFLPGVGEIRRVERRLVERIADPSIRIAPLYGNLPLSAQDLAIAPSPPGTRKVVLATSIAETSLTIEGVRVVVDSGLRRAPRFSPRSGMTHLETLRVSRASADQRRGRAGRLGPGVCYRQWTRHTHDHLAPFDTPEILEADLAPLALDLAAWGAPDPNDLAWLDPPPRAAYESARALLADLGALDTRGNVTPHGKAMAELAVNPRLAHMLLRGNEIGHGALACEIAALLTERDLFRSKSSVPQADLRLRLEVLHRQDGYSHSGLTIERSVASNVRRQADDLRRRLKLARQPVEIDAAGLLLAFAYPDRIARRNPGKEGRFLLRNGRSATLGANDPLTDADFLVAADLGGLGQELTIYRAAPVTRRDIEEHFHDLIEETVETSWFADAGAVRSVRYRKLGALVLSEAPVPDPAPNEIRTALLDGIRLEGLDLLPWSKSSDTLRQRIAFLRSIDPTWPDLSDENLMATLPEWLGPYLDGLRSRQDLQRLDLTSILLGLLSWPQRQELDRLAPTHVTVPSGSSIPIDYANPESPVLAVRLQEMFGATETPRIAGGRVPLTIHLLSPAHRPVQITRDLAGFWKSGYFEVKKDLKGRYPKHYWPDDPLTANPTNRVRPL